MFIKHGIQVAIHLNVFRLLLLLLLLVLVLVLVV